MNEEKDRLELGNERRLRFINFCNIGGSHGADFAKDLLSKEDEISPEEVSRDVLFVGRKIKEFRHERCIRPRGLKIWKESSAYRAWEEQWRLYRAGKISTKPDPTMPAAPEEDMSPEDMQMPPVPCDTEQDIIVNRQTLLWTLGLIPDEVLATSLILPRLTTHGIGNVRDLRDATRLTGGRPVEQRA